MGNKKYIPTKEKEDIVKLLGDVNMTLEILKMLNRDKRKIFKKTQKTLARWEQEKMSLGKSENEI